MRFTRPVQLAPGMPVDGFSCGREAVDAWVAAHALTAKSRGTAVVYVSHPEGADPMAVPPAGLYALSSLSVARADVSGGWLRRNAPEQIPAILLGALGVDSRYQGLGLGRMLLHDAAARALAAADAVGAKALVVDPLDGAEEFYARNGFRQIPSSTRMYAPLRLK